MKAMILAAGEGSRMRPLTNHTPKPLLKVGGKPLIVWQIEKLKQAGFTEIIINIAWLAEQIPAVLGNGSQWGVTLHYSNEQDEGALETAGGIVKALPLLGEQPFLVVNADVWCEFDYSSLQLQTHDLAHLVMVNNPSHNFSGDFALKQQRLYKIGTPRYTFSGIGLYRPQLFNQLSYGRQALAPLLHQAIDKQKVSGELYQGGWRDIGTPERLQQLDLKLQYLNIRTT
jgi:MurNAc alpha-1-phosphate uridylyltransferase